MIIDGAKAHCSLDALQYAVDHGIHILCLPPHTSHFLQVADLSIFGPFKSAWNEVCADHKLQLWRSSSPLAWSGIKHGDIIPLLQRAWEKSITPDNVRAGFRKAGIRPFNRNIWKTSVQDTDHICSCPLHESLSRHATDTVSSSRLMQSFVNVPHFRSAVLSSTSSSSSKHPNGDSSDENDHSKKKRRLKVTEGLLMTSAESMQRYQEEEEKKKEEEARKAQKRATAAERKKEREEKRRLIDQRKKEREEKKKAKENAVMRQKGSVDEARKPLHAHNSLPSQSGALNDQAYRDVDHEHDDDHQQAMLDHEDDKENDSYASNIPQPRSSLPSTYMSQKADKRVRSSSKPRAHIQHAVVPYELIHARDCTVRLRRVV